MSSKLEPKIVELKGDDDRLIFKVTDRGDACDLAIIKPNTEEEAEKLVQAVAKVAVAVANSIALSEFRCGHVGCIMQEIEAVTVAHFKEFFPEEYARVRAYQLDDTARGKDENLH